MLKQFSHSRRGSALLIGLIITVLLSILVIGFMEKVLRVGQNAKSIEQSTQAYYLASGIVERQLQKNTELKTQPWLIEKVDTPTTRAYSGASLGVLTGSTSIPASGKGNSPFDSTKNYNLISLDRPVQIVIPKDVTWNDVIFEFRVPNTAWTGTTSIDTTLTGVILWTLGNKDTVLFASGGINGWLLGATDFYNSTNVRPFSIASKSGFYYGTNGSQIQQISSNPLDFYTSVLGASGDKCSDALNQFQCTLKVSMLKPIAGIINTKTISNLPFLEYRIRLQNTNPSIPTQFMTLNAEGYVGNYIRKREVQIPQITTNTALDFAVLQ